MNYKAMDSIKIILAVILIANTACNSLTKIILDDSYYDTARAVVCGQFTKPFFESHYLSCYFNEVTDDLPFAYNFTFAEDSIFFLETSCKGGLNNREACSVESAARSHQHRQINVLFLGPVAARCLDVEPLYTLQQYKNVNLLRVNIEQYSKDTPLETVMFTVFGRSNLPIHHNSDILRYLTLYKYGGIYLDLDVIVLKSFDLLPQAQNWVGVEEYYPGGFVLGGGLISIAKDGVGFNVIKTVLRILNTTNKPLAHNYNANTVLKEALSEICSPVVFKHLSNGTSMTCGGFAVYDRDYFYPLDFNNSSKYFDTDLDLKSFSGSFALHVFNAISYKKPIKLHSTYAKMMKAYCPAVYQKSTVLQRIKPTKY